ncbi:hypothetical protein GFL82_00555 [Rhizobium laguerreae]|nr:hypothetical protein [Rhizobium laguerreae]
MGEQSSWILSENSCSSPSMYRYEDQALIPSPRLCRAHSLKPEISGNPRTKARHSLNGLEDRVRPKAVICFFCEERDSNNSGNTLLGCFCLNLMKP